MKPHKTLFLAAFFFFSFALISYHVPAQKHIIHADLRVRVVPGASDQKKKDTQHTADPKPAPTSKKENSGFFCSETSAVKDKLAVANGGSPK